MFGLGCAPYDEVAVRKLLALKQRPEAKGLILIAADYSQLLDYVDDSKIPQDKRFQVFSHWPGPVTLVLPAKSQCAKFFTWWNLIPLRYAWTAFEPGARIVSSPRYSVWCRPVHNVHRQATAA